MQEKLAKLLEIYRVYFELLKFQYYNSQVWHFKQTFWKYAELQ